jgi:uncharacterized membrane protein
MLSLLLKISDGRAANTDRFCIAILFALSFMLMFKQLASSSYFTVVVTDAFIYPSWAWQFREALKEGAVYPRWMPLDFWGHGSPVFLLYPPLAYYLVALFNVFTGSIITAMNMVKFTTLFLSGAGVYFLVKEFHPARVALWSAVFCVILPYNIALMYFFGSFAATVACLWFAPVLLFIHRFYDSGDYKHLVYSGACYGGMVLTHLVISYMFSFVICGFVIYLAVISKRPAFTGVIPAVILTGLSLSAAYVLPVILERRFLNPEVFTTAANGFIYSNMFLLPDRTSMFTDQGAFWPVHYHTMVLHGAIFCLLILILLARSMQGGKREGDRNASSADRFFLLTALCSVLLMFGISSILWRTIPFFKYILFPARWMHITALAVSFLSAMLFAVTDSGGRTRTGQLVLPVVLLISCLALDLFYISKAPAYDEKVILPAIAVNNVLEHLPKGARIDRIDGENGADDKPRFSIKGAGSGEFVDWKSAARVVVVRAECPVLIRFRTFNFPGWRAFVDGAGTGISTDSETGEIVVNVPRGNHRLELAFVDTPARRFGKIVSLVSTLILSGSLVVRNVARRMAIA